MFLLLIIIVLSTSRFVAFKVKVYIRAYTLNYDFMFATTVLAAVFVSVRTGYYLICIVVCFVIVDI